MIDSPSRLVIRAGFPRLSSAAIEPFRERSTAFVVDTMNGRGGLDHTIKPLDPGSRFAGSAITARDGARDNLAALAAIDMIEPGDVLVISAQGFKNAAALGDNMALLAKVRGAAAIVTDGTARDAAEIVEMGIPVFCAGTTPNSAFPTGPGAVGLPIAMGEVTVDSGDLVMGDGDGVVVVPRALVATATERIEAIAAAEANMKADIESGELRTFMELYPELRDQIMYVD
ncbi:MAG TPA: RraA family protein [Conexibacter sp.]|nr:RraA family protein [Conexibacter sp.]